MLAPHADDSAAHRRKQVPSDRASPPLSCSSAVLCPASSSEEARQVTIPLLVLLQWDDEGNDRQMALDLFDASGSKERTRHANMGGHTGVPRYEEDDGTRFFTRHLT